MAPASAGPGARGSRGKFPPPRQDGDAYLIYVTPLSYEKWAFEGIDDDGLVGLKISEHGFRIVTTADGHVLRQFPMSEVRSWQGSKKYSPSSSETSARARTRTPARSRSPPRGSAPSCNSWTASSSGPLSQRRAKSMTDPEFAALVRELDVLDADDPRRAEAALNFAGADKWVTSWQCIELLEGCPREPTPESTPSRRCTRGCSTRRRSGSSCSSSRVREERDEAWEMISPSVGKDGERVRRSASG